MLFHISMSTFKFNLHCSIFHDRSWRLGTAAWDCMNTWIKKRFLPRRTESIWSILKIEIQIKLNARVIPDQKFRFIHTTNFSWRHRKNFIKSLDKICIEILYFFIWKHHFHYSLIYLTYDPFRFPHSVLFFIEQAKKITTGRMLRE